MSRGSVLRDERGQTSVEYAMVVSVAIGIALLLGGVLAPGVFDTFWSIVRATFS